MTRYDNASIVIGEKNALAAALITAGISSVSYKRSLSFDYSKFEHVIVTAFNPHGKKRIVRNSYEKKLIKLLNCKKITYISSLRCSDINTPDRHKFYVENKLRNEKLFLKSVSTSRVLRIPNLISTVLGNFYDEMRKNIEKNQIRFDLTHNSSFNILPPDSLVDVVADFASTPQSTCNILASNSLTVKEISTFIKKKFIIDKIEFGEKIEESVFNEKYYSVKINLPKKTILERITKELKK